MRLHAGRRKRATDRGLENRNSSRWRRGFAHCLDFCGEGIDPRSTTEIVCVSSVHVLSSADSALGKSIATFASVHARQLFNNSFLFRPSPKDTKASDFKVYVCFFAFGELTPAGCRRPLCICVTEGIPGEMIRGEEHRNSGNLGQK